MTITSSLRFLYILGESGLLCPTTDAAAALLFCQNLDGQFSTCPLCPPIIDGPKDKGWSCKQHRIYLQNFVYNNAFFSPGV